MDFDYKGYTILVVEDELLSLEYLVKILQERSFNVLFAHNGLEAYDQYINNKIDVILTDIRMPMKNGMEFVEQVRESNKIIPIIYMSAFAKVDVLLQTMKHHINGFLVKPVHIKEMFECINEALERYTQIRQNLQEIDSVVLMGGACVNLRNKTVYYENQEIFFSKKEYSLLELLIINRMSIMPKEIIEEYLWQGIAISPSSVKTLVNKLRDKIGKDAIITVKNIGYRINLK